MKFSEVAASILKIVAIIGPWLNRASRLSREGIMQVKGRSYFGIYVT